MAGIELREVGWRFDVSPKYPCQPSVNNNYIDVPINEETNEKIISALSTLHVFCQSGLVQLWAPEVNGKTCLLVTRGQLFGFCGINEELQSHHEAWLDKKLYVYLPKVFEDPKKGEDIVYKDIAYGLPGRVFLNCTPEYQPPGCKDAVFSKKWGSFALPLIEGDKCVGVLEFIMDKTQVSYENETIDQVYKALKNAGFQSSIQINRPKPTSLNPRKRSRKTKSSDISSYDDLSPYFGLPSDVAAKKLKISNDVKAGTFKNICRDAGIPEWPGKRGNSSRISSFQTKIVTELEPLDTNEMELQDCNNALFSQNPFEYRYFEPVQDHPVETPTNQKSYQINSSGTPLASSWEEDLNIPRDFMPYKDEMNNALFSQNHFEYQYFEPVQDHPLETPTNQKSYQINLSGTPLASSWEEDLTIPLDFMLHKDEMKNKRGEGLDMLEHMADEFLNLKDYPDIQV